MRHTKFPGTHVMTEAQGSKRITANTISHNTPPWNSMVYAVYPGSATAVNCLPDRTTTGPCFVKTEKKPLDSGNQIK